jgi:hypothetical protein
MEQQLVGTLAIEAAQKKRPTEEASTSFTATFEKPPKKPRLEFHQLKETQSRERLQWLGEKIFKFSQIAAQEIKDSKHQPLKYEFSSHGKIYTIHFADVYSPLSSLAEMLDKETELKIAEIIYAMDSSMISREGIRQLARAEPALQREGVVSEFKTNITLKSQAYLPLE